MTLFHVDGNQLTSLKGEVSTFHQIVPLDLEGLERSLLDSIYQFIETDLINTEGVLKVYYLNGKIYVNAFKGFNFSQGEVIPQENPVKTFLENDEANVNFYENYLTCEDKYIRLLSVTDLPQSLDLGASSLFPDFVLNIKKVPQIEAKKTLNLKRRLHFSALFKGIKDIESESAYSEAESLLEGVTRSEKGLFQVEMFFLLRGATKVELDEVTDKAIQYFKGLDAKLFVEERGLSFFFQGLIPGVMPSFKRKFPCGSDYLAYLIPFHRDYIHENGMKLVARSGDEVFVDLFNQNSLNFNILITGTAGQGKSMLANKILDHELKNGTKAMVLDLGNSFRKSALYHGGEILSEKFNPFQFKSPWYLKAFILSTMDEQLSKKDQGRLFECIKAILEKGVTSFQELIAELEADFNGIRHYFAEIEEFFTDEVRPSSQFTYCDLTNYPEAVKAPLIIYLIEAFKHLDGKKIFVFDECWSLLTKNADYIAECFRTFRKHLASAVAISQNLDDFSSTQLGRVIIQNTHYKFLFKQKVGGTEFIDAHTQDLIEGVFSKKGIYSETLFFTENQKKPVRYVPTCLEYEMFTSDKRDNLDQEYYWQEKGRFLPYQTAMNNYVTIKYPNWRIDYEAA